MSHKAGGNGPTRHVAVRLDLGTLARMDALVPLYSKTWRKAKRSDVLRALILAGLAVEEPKAKKK